MDLISVLGEDEGIKLITELMSDNLLIPFFGAGISRGGKAKKFNVPDGNESTKLMKDLVINHRPGLQDALEDANFNDAADFFFKCVPQAERDIFFRDYFTNVTITDERKEIINFDWPYAYTLNIDDGIERSSNLKAVYPYTKLKRPRGDIGFLFKLHGDASNEITYDFRENIVFCYKQYIKILRSDENQDFLSFIKADFIEKNIIYIGCSLRDEKDLAIIYDEVSDKVLKNLRIILKDYDISEKEELSLQDYGINTIIRVSDYTTFFKKWIKEYTLNKAQEKVAEYRYKNPTVEIIKEKKGAIDAFCDTTYFDYPNNKFIISDLLIERKAFREIAKKISANNCLFLLGRRLSGKTAIISSICKMMKGYAHILFPSKDTCDEKVVAELLRSSTNTLFIFDSNSLTSTAYKTVSNALQDIAINNNKIILFSNSSDNFITDHLEAEVISIDNRFDETELRQFNVKANKYGLNKRRSSDSNLDYLNYVHESQKIATRVDSIAKATLTFDEKILFILLCARDKVYYSDLFSFGIFTEDIEKIIGSLSPLLEIEKISQTEISTHSSHKIVHNSKRILINKLRELDNDDIRCCIEHIVKKLYKDNSKFRLYIEVILFDTLNQIFGKDAGAGKLIYSVYERLETLLTDSLHYWLQRAKSIYRLFPKDYTKLRDAYQYAKKVYCDANDNSSLHLKGALSTALISSLLYSIEVDAKEKKAIQREVITLSHEVIFSNHFKNTKTGLKHELGGRINRRNVFDLIIYICNEYIRSEPYGDLTDWANKIVTELRKAN